jgi:hypothetical protein
MEILAALKELRDYGLAGYLLIALVGGYRGWYVFRREHVELKKSEEMWRHIAMRLLNITEKGVPS